MDTLISILIVFVFFFLAYLGFARIASNKKEWQNERKDNYQFALRGAGFVVAAILILWLFDSATGA